MTLDYNAVATNLCSQLLALQASIANREENPNIPTMQEVNMQVRLLGCLDKLQKFAAREEKAAQATAAATPVSNIQSPPISESFAAANQHLLDVNNEQELEEKIDHPGGINSRMWVVYNMLQYLKPVPQRTFVQTEADLRTTISRSKVFSMLKTLQQYKAA